MTSRILVLAGLSGTIIISVSFTNLIDYGELLSSLSIALRASSHACMRAQVACDLLHVLNVLYTNLSHQIS